MQEKKKHSSNRHDIDCSIYFVIVCVRSTWTCFFSRAYSRYYIFYYASHWSLLQQQQQKEKWLEKIGSFVQQHFCATRKFIRAMWFLANERERRKKNTTTPRSIKTTMMTTRCRCRCWCWWWWVMAMWRIASKTVTTKQRQNEASRWGNNNIQL